MERKHPKPEQVFDLWRMGCGGVLKSAKTPWAGGGESGSDYPLILSLHVERFFALKEKAWRELAIWAVDHAYRLEDYPVWLTTTEKLFALGMGEFITKAPNMRGRALYGHLRCEFGQWLEANPLPEQTGWFEE